MVTECCTYQASLFIKLACAPESQRFIGNQVLMKSKNNLCSILPQIESLSLLHQIKLSKSGHRHNIKLYQMQVEFIYRLLADSS